MPKGKTGYVFFDKRRKSWNARVTYRNEQGQQRSKLRSFDSKSAANDGLKKLTWDLEHEGPEKFDREKITFAQLADYYEEHYAIAPVYVDGRKVAGLRSYKDQRRRIKVLRAHFGKRKLKDISYSSIEKLKRDLLSKPTYKDTPRTLADVHRILTILKTMLNVAEREDWIPRNPFGRGKALISMADEKPRERVLSKEEEQRLLAVCTGRKAALRPLLVCALDTGMRRGELISVKWKDVDLEGRLIHIQAFNTKTMRGRTVPITDRLAAELERLAEQSNGDPDGLVFNSKGWIRYTLKRACKTAGVADFRLHDARHTCATRLVQSGMPLTEVGRILGHTTPAMTYRYANADETTMARAAAKLDAFHAEGAMLEAADVASVLIN